MKKTFKKILASLPVVDGCFRRFIWSHMHFPEYEMKFLDDLDTDGLDVAVDVGAALGSYCWILNRKFKTTLAFEPGDEHYNYLKRLLLGTNICLEKKAVGRDSRTVEFFTPGADTEAYHSATVSVSNPVVSQGDVTVKKIEQVSLDTYWDNCFDESRVLDLLKIDIEGYEMEAMKGAERLISSHHPLIICEIEARHNDKYQEVFRFLGSIGYTCFFWRDHHFNILEGFDIESLQRQEDLDIRLGDDFDPDNNTYINNFVFQHTETRIKVPL